jgi:hypothetical protein
MIVGEREGLIARIGQIRRLKAGTAASARQSTVTPRDDGVPGLEARVADLERLVEGLQDAVHRESERHGKLIAELQAQTRPEVMGAALAEDARSRGL